jgi:pantothenate kinase
MDAGAAIAVLRDPTAHLLGLLAGAARPRLLVGLAGLPGSGKSTLARRIASDVNMRCGAGVMAALGMDGFHWSRATLARFPDPAAALARRGAPWTFDAAGFASRIRALRQAAQQQPPASVAWPGFEHGVGDPVEDAVLIDGSVRLVLIEGLYLLHRDHAWNLDGLLDECWYLDVDMDTAMERLVARHQAAWSMTREQAQAKLALNDRQNAAMVAHSRQHADWLVRPGPH